MSETQSCSKMEEYYNSDVKNQKDIESISNVIQKYVEGGRKGDSKIMKNSFRENAIIHGYIGGNLLAGPIKLLFDWVDENPPAEELKGEIVNIDLFNTIATARVECTNWLGNRFTDQFTLLREENFWVITSKVFHTH